jgi:hypothetical protein
VINFEQFSHDSPVTLYGFTQNSSHGRKVPSNPEQRSAEAFDVLVLTCWRETAL